MGACPLAVPCLLQNWRGTCAPGVRPVLDRIPHFAELLSTTEDQDFGDLRLAEGSGRPLGSAYFVTGLERLLGRPVAHRTPGHKPTASVAGAT